jgi:prolyl oligopeptidase
VRQILAYAFCLTVAACAVAQTIHGREGITLPPPPAVDAIPVADDYFGTKITDNYRWLEDAKSPETRAFIDAQNAYTARYLKQARIRPQVLDDLDALENVSEAGAPIQRGDSYFFSKRLTGEQQFSIYVRHASNGLSGAKSAGAKPSVTNKDERLIDPAALSRDTNLSVSLRDVSRDGTLLAYAVRTGGADEASIHVFNVKTRKTLEDELPAARYFGVTFAPDGKSLYYSRNNKQGTLLYQHVLGTRNSRDTLIFGREFRGELLTGDDLFSGVVTDDGRYLVIQIDRGVPARRVDIVYRDLTKPGSPFEVLVWGLDSRFSAIYARGAWYVKTDYKAPKGIILRADPGILPDVWKTIVPEGPDVIDDWSIVGGKIYVNQLKNVSTQTTAYTLDGKPAGTISRASVRPQDSMAARRIAMPSSVLSPSS